MRLRALGTVLVGSSLLALACGDGGGPDDDGTTLRPRLGGPISDFPVRAGDAGVGPVVVAPIPGGTATAGGGTTGGGITGGGTPNGTPGPGGTVGGGTVGGGTVGGGGTLGGGGTQAPSQDAGVPPADLDAGTQGDAGDCLEDASGCAVDAGEEAAAPTSVDPEAGTFWPGPDAWRDGWPGWHRPR